MLKYVIMVLALSSYGLLAFGLCIEVGRKALVTLNEQNVTAKFGYRVKTMTRPTEHSQ